METSIHDTYLDHFLQILTTYNFFIFVRIIFTIFIISLQPFLYNSYKSTIFNNICNFYITIFLNICEQSYIQFPKPLKIFKFSQILTVYNSCHSLQFLILHMQYLKFLAIYNFCNFIIIIFYNIHNVG